MVEVREQVLQAEAVEETEELADERPLPAEARPAEVVPFSMEARSVAIAAAGGIVAGCGQRRPGRPGDTWDGDHATKGTRRARQGQGPSALPCRGPLVEPDGVPGRLFLHDM